MMKIFLKDLFYVTEIIFKFNLNYKIIN